MQTDFLIVGGGAVGLTSAQALLQMGYRVTLVERGTTGQEASWAGGGILSPLCPWDYGEAVTQLALRGMGMFGEAMVLLQASTGIDPEYRRCGMLVLPPMQEELALEWCANHQFAARQMDLAGVLDGQQGRGLLLPDVAQVRNPRLLQALRERVTLFGGKIVEQREVLGFETAGDRVTGLRTSQGTLVADAYVVATGAWSKVLLGEHGRGLEVKPVRGQILLFKFDTPPIDRILLKESLYFIPRQDGHVLVGSTLEDVGFDKSVTAEARTSLMQGVRELFPTWPEPIQQWAGFRPGSPDNIPTIGRHPYLANLYANTGHFRYGVTMSLASAELLVNEIEGEQQPFDTAAYAWR
ncbi:MAG: glycine oxidase ThiO [Gallionella sp.]|jgi:glycine oxidase|nr:glycine oxidase ThiO [Gallionella sp.]MCK9354323.1 glycine oxidase ThiO [Gallionella sp.]